jgi:pyrroloquinoline-quinone synthase
MHRDQVHDIVTAALIGRRLLEHPFYRRWEAGELAEGELAAYAEQYRHVERALPAVLASVADGLAPGDARELVAANLAEETSVPEAHAVLFESFALAVGAGDDVAPGPATAAMIAAYELQAAEIAASKSAGLAAHYGLDRAGTRFWDVHAEMESAHADWSLEALAFSAIDPTAIAAGARAGAEAWWAFLDEREALAPSAA